MSYDVGYDSYSGLTQYYALFDVNSATTTCSSVILPDDWFPIPEYLYTDPPTEQRFRFVGAGAAAGCFYSTEVLQEDSPGSATYTVLASTGYDVSSQELVLNYSGSQEETLRFTFRIWLLSDPSATLLTKDYTIKAQIEEE